MGVARRRVGTALALALLAAAGCGSPNLAPLPAEPSNSTAPVDGIPAAANVQGAVEFPERWAHPDPLSPSTDQDQILPGVVVLSPALSGEGAIATFGLRNDGTQDLPDLILAVVFAIRAGGDEAPLRPRVATVEAPLRKGESREFRVAASSIREGEKVEGFRVAPGLPEVLTAAQDGAAGTTFLGGLLECVALDVDLTADDPRVTVDLAARGDAADGAPLPRLECQLLLGRAGRLLWTGPWILVPSPDAESGGVRRIRWNIHGAPGVAGSVLFLRVRERR
jgi:hypothetical protein